MKTKKEKLEQLDTLVLDRMISIMEDLEDDKILELSSLGVPMNYLKNNQVVSDKPKSSIEEESKERLRKAKERREKGMSK